MDARQKLEITNATIADGLRGMPEDEQLGTFCERLLEAGVPLRRAAIGNTTLHPVVAGHNFEWWRGGEGTKQEAWLRATNMPDADFDKHPFAFMYRNNVQRLRRQLDRPNAPLEFPLLERLRKQGATDYLALSTHFGADDARGPLSGFASSWTTDADGGFSQKDLETIETLLPVLALGIKSSATYRAAESALVTYLGADAGHRVLSGAIERGSTETIRAVLFYADLQDFTKIADTTPGDDLIVMLNQYFGCLVDSVHEHGGQVLKFVGDGLLAIFRLSEDHGVCASAIAAADASFARIDGINVERRALEQPTTRFHLALHLGDVLYGNIGGHDRLDFTVVGPAVNEVSRIEGMCRSLEQDVVMSAAFAEAARTCTSRIVSLGRFALRGVKRPQELFALTADSYPQSASLVS